MEELDALTNEVDQLRFEKQDLLSSITVKHLNNLQTIFRNLKLKLKRSM